jgi:hypothetical protein
VPIEHPIFSGLSDASIVVLYWVMLSTCLLLLLLQVFVLLVTEMVMFMALIVPLPFTWRRKLFTFVSESPIIAKLQYGMKVRKAKLRSNELGYLTIV